MLLVRRAQPADIEGLAQVHASAGRDAYRSFLPAEVLDAVARLESRRRLWTEVLDRLGDQTSATGPEGLWVAVDTDEPSEVLGFIHTDASTDDDGTDESGVITTFYVATDRQGGRLGERLIQRATDHLLGCGRDDLRLWTLEGNTRAQAFYAKRGWTLDGANRPVPAPDYEATEVRMRTDRATLEARPIWASSLPMLDALCAHPVGDGRYLADAPAWYGPRVFGGAVLAQALTAAAQAAVEAGGAGATGRAHSLHAHFLRPVHGGPVELRTEAIRTGRTFTTIRVDSVQHGRVAATSTVSFHADEDDVPYQLPMPTVPRPDALPRDDDPPPPFEARWIGPTERRADGTYESTRRCWIRPTDDLPDHPLAALAAMAYLSDLTGTSFRPHNLDEWGTHTDASIDHAVWLHRPPPAGGWLYADFHTSSTPAAAAPCAAPTTTKPAPLSSPWPRSS